MDTHTYTHKPYGQSACTTCGAEQYGPMHTRRPSTEPVCDYCGRRHPVLAPWAMVAHSIDPSDLDGTDWYPWPDRADYDTLDDYQAARVAVRRAAYGAA